MAHIHCGCFLRLVYWNARKSAYVGLPAGIPVDAIDACDSRADRVLSQATTDADGCVHLRYEADEERRPDLYFRYRVPDDLPAAIDLDTGALDAWGLPIPREWATYSHYVLEDPTQPGYWPDHTGSGLGDPLRPYVFDVLEDVPKLRAGNTVEALIDGVDLLRRAEELIEAAEKSIHIEVMLYFNDPMGWRITDRLLKKARQGVEVRLMFDVRTTMDSYKLLALKRFWVGELIHLSSEERDARLARLQEEEDAERVRGDTTSIRETLSSVPNLQFIDTSFPYLEILPRPSSDAPPAYQELTASLPFFTIARIDHRKMLVVDGKVALIGGQNCGQEYLYETPFDPDRDVTEEDQPKWHDLAIAIRGPAVRDIQALFHERWGEEGGDAFDLGPRELGVGLDPLHPYFPRLDEVPGGAPVSIINTTPGVRLHVRDEILGRLARAQRQILIEVAYFTNQDALAYLQMAAERGVRVVCIFTGEHSDSLDFLYAGRVQYRDLLRAGVEIYEYHHRMTHAKVVIVDDVSIVGSANINNASFFSHYEIDAVVPDAGFTATLDERLFQEDIRHSRRIQEQDLDELMNINVVARIYVKGVVGPLF